MCNFLPKKIVFVILLLNTFLQEIDLTSAADSTDADTSEENSQIGNTGKVIFSPSNEPLICDYNDKRIACESVIHVVGLFTNQYA